MEEDWVLRSVFLCPGEVSFLYMPSRNEREAGEELEKAT